MKQTPLYRFGKVVVPPIFRITNPLIVQGREEMPKNGRVIICCNHVTMRDPILVSMVHKRQVYYMAKAELFDNKFVGGIIGSLGAFPVHRGQGDVDAMASAKQLLNKEQVVGIFIEGTRSRTGQLLKPKTGAVMLAYETHSPILPMCITAPGGKVPSSFQKLAISCGKLIQPEELGIEEGNVSSYRKAARHVMEQIAQLRERDLLLLQNKKNSAGRLPEGKE